jgi:putative transposase
VEALLLSAKRHIRIGTVYLDRGFFSVECISAMENIGVRWMMPVPLKARVATILDSSPVGTVIEDYTITSGVARGRGKDRLFGRKVSFRLAIVKGTKYPDLKIPFATNRKVTSQNAQMVCDRYGKRWGIETAFRVQDGFLPKTTSKNYSVRLFYFLLSILLYNAWVLANLLIGMRIGRTLTKPVLTARMFVVVFYTGLKYDDGG